MVEARLGASDRARHSVAVGRLMRGIAKALGEDVIAWQVVGLCHDLDFQATANDRTQHGIVAARWLEGRLPPQSLDAIRAHDYRTGLHAESAIADGLKLADALAVAQDEVGDLVWAVLASEAGFAGLDRLALERSYLAELINEHALRLGLSAEALGAIGGDALF